MLLYSLDIGTTGRSHRCQNSELLLFSGGVVVDGGVNYRLFSPGEILPENTVDYFSTVF